MSIGNEYNLIAIILAAFGIASGLSGVIVRECAEEGGAWVGDVAIGALLLSTVTMTVYAFLGMNLLFLECVSFDMWVCEIARVLKRFLPNFATHPLAIFVLLPASTLVAYASVLTIFLIRGWTDSRRERYRKVGVSLILLGLVCGGVAGIVAIISPMAVEYESAQTK